MSFFRSQPMGLYSLVIPRESAWDILNEIGSLSLFHFLDMFGQESAFNRPFFNVIKRCDDTLLQVDFIKEQMKNFGYEVMKCQNKTGFLQRFHKKLKDTNTAELYFLDKIGNEITGRSEYLQRLLDHFRESLDTQNMLCQYRAIVLMSLLQVKKSFGEQLEQEFSTIRVIGGTIETRDELSFQKTIFRVSKGNAVLDVSPIDEKIQTKGFQLISSKNFAPRNRSSFLLIFQSNQNGAFQKRLEKILESFNALSLEIPQTEAARLLQVQGYETKISEANQYLRATEKEIHQFLDEFKQISGDINDPESGACSYIEELELFIKKQKIIYGCLNMLKPQTTLFKGYVWIPQSKVDIVLQKLHEISQQKPDIAMGQIYEVEEYGVKPPTYIRTTDFIYPFQEIVNTYGVPNYQEINPAYFTIISFPFLFGVMFGDIGHGAILFAISLTFFSIKVDISKPQPTDGLYRLRYLFLLMGIFAVFSGFIYNEFFSIPLGIIQPSCYNESTGVRTPPDCVQMIGMDPLWGRANNKLAFFNSLKMKLSIVLGVSQMLLGVLLKGANKIFFREWLEFFSEFIPQLLFLLSTFGYMCFLIITKWLTDYSADTSQAPSILTLMINFGLKEGSTDGADLFGEPGFQTQVQKILLLIVLVTVPVMNLVKPLVMKMKHSNDHPQRVGDHDAFVDEEEELNAQNPDHIVLYGKKHEFQFSEEFIHQCIETIEFVLGSVSHTASYLRLWALSLAHGQLAEVFFDQTLKGAVQDGNYIAMVIGYVVFASITFGVLMCMDVMECFLHTLRLHWVEFQSQFYKGEGYQFNPVCFQTLLNG